MLGWSISVWKKVEGGNTPAKGWSPGDTLLAAWETSLHGLRWLDQLVEQGHAINLGSQDEWTITYTVTAEYVIPIIIGGPPDMRPGTSRLFDELSALSGKGEEKSAAEIVAAARCRLDEWLLVDASDLD